MVRDSERVARIQRALDASRLDAFVLTLPSNVRLASGYWPVIGNTIAIATRDGVIGLLAPEDEVHLAGNSWADFVQMFSTGSLDAVTDPVDAVKPHVGELASTAGVRARARVGYEGASFDPSAYASGFAYGASLPALLSSALPQAEILEVTETIDQLRSTLTEHELIDLRTACRVACTAFECTAARLRPGMREYEVAQMLRTHLREPAHPRADGYVYCMSGVNASRAYASFQETTDRAIREGDTVLVHCNSCCGGLWTDVTRTFVVGRPSREVKSRLDAIFSARHDALDAIAAGVRASTVDGAARNAMARAGFESEFRHSTGHGVGFAAINHNARPRLHPHSSDVLETGMVCNIEPAAYVPDAFGIRHCDMVAVGAHGPELLTPFHTSVQDLQIGS
ncbi:MAG TPA: Xaa-Pro peptidase family protein [Vicinamibacterales bacterium]|nr:Xaa-Pro peptidase family protein [Vicinamibacterales bacterium]